MHHQGFASLHSRPFFGGTRLQALQLRSCRPRVPAFGPACVQAAPARPPPSEGRPQGQRTRKPKAGPHRLRPHEKQAGASESLRLNKAIASAGLASRRSADELILAGKVKVNGQVVAEPGTRVNMATDKVVVEGRALTAAAVPRKYYFALNKPKGYVCSTKLEAGRGGAGGGEGRLVTDLFKDWLREWRQRQPKGSIPPRLFPVGRLDVQSIGLIFITNDGDWAHKVMHPSTGITKEYSVTLDRKPSMQDLEKIGAGCEVDGAHVQPVAVALDDTDLSKPNRIRVVVSEGRNREVRNLVANAGLDVRVLRRVRIGGYRLPRDLGFGAFRELRPHEVRRVINAGADRVV